MRILILSVFSAFLLSGCLSQGYPVPTTESSTVSEDLAFVGDNMPELPFGKPIASAPSDNECIKAYQDAELALVAKMPFELSAEEVSHRLIADHRLVGFWFEDSEMCGVYDIVDIKITHWSHSPHDQLLADLHSLEIEGGDVVTSTHSNRNNRFFVKVRKCPLCI